MTYEVVTLIIRALAFSVAIAYGVRVLRRRQQRRSVTASVMVIGSGALLYGGLAPFGLVDMSWSRVIYTAVAFVIFVACLTLITVDD